MDFCDILSEGVMHQPIGTLSNRTPPPRGRGDLDELKSLSPANGHEWLITLCFEML